MYQNFFNLHTAPFCLGPQLEFLYRSTSFDRGLGHLEETVTGSGQMCLLTGPIGTGKTLVVRSFLESHHESNQIALITFSKVDPRGMLKLILGDLGLSFAPASSFDQLKDRFSAFREEVVEDGQSLMVVLDEAQSLPLETLNCLPELLLPGVKLFLVGQPEIRNRIKESRLDINGEQDNAAGQLSPLSETEVPDYLQHRLTVAGNPGISFEEKSLDKIMQFSLGIPRVINTLAHKALLAAYLEDRQMVLARDVVPAEMGDLSSLPGMKKEKPLAMKAAAGSSREGSQVKRAKETAAVPPKKQSPKAASPKAAESTRIGIIDEVLGTIERDCPQITGRAVLSAEGGFLANQLPAGSNAESLANMVRALVVVSQKVSAEVLNRELRQTIVETDEGVLILVPINSGSVLALFTGEPTRLGLILMELKGWLVDLRRVCGEINPQG